MLQFVQYCGRLSCGKSQSRKLGTIGYFSADVGEWLVPCLDCANRTISLLLTRGIVGHTKIVVFLMQDDIVGYFHLVLARPVLSEIPSPLVCESCTGHLRSLMVNTTIWVIKPG